jgi:TRAP-type mannitol/chloroaromatic compound transport system substrate-binding protein
MKRRKFLELATKGAVGGTAMGLAAACTTATAPVPATVASEAPKQADAPATTATEAPAQSAPAVTGPAQTFEWKMATSWPVSLDTIYGGAVIFAERVAAMTGGKFKITPEAAGKLAPATQVLDVVQQGAVQMGHTASYYYIGKSWVCAFATAVPFGFNLQQQNAWLFEGGGLKLIQDVYAKKFNVINFPAGNTACQWGGWFRKEINNVNDLKGLKMRIPGIGGQVMAKLGVNVVTKAGGEIFQALQTGEIDAAEWVNPYDDEKLGFNKVCQFAYYPGWWEPAPTLDVMINLNEWKKLPAEYQEIVKTAAHEANTVMPARYDAKAPEALERLIAAGVQFKPYPQDILTAARDATFALIDEKAAADADVKAVYDSWKTFRAKEYKFHSLSEGTFRAFADSQVK